MEGVRRCGELNNTMRDGITLVEAWYQVPYALDYSWVTNGVILLAGEAQAKLDILSKTDRVKLVELLLDHGKLEEVNESEEVLCAWTDREASQGFMEWEEHQAAGLVMTADVNLEAEVIQAWGLLNTDEVDAEEVCGVEKGGEVIGGAGGDVPSLSLQRFLQGDKAFYQPDQHAENIVAATDTIRVHVPQQKEEVREGTMGFPTNRRVERRPLDVEVTLEEVEAWFQEVGITLGPRRWAIRRGKLFKGCVTRIATYSLRIWRIYNKLILWSTQFR